jgi:chromosome partitioning protein
MAAKIIAVGNGKGGTCKTTVSVALSTGLVREGNRVLLVDLDIQRSAMKWLQKAQRAGMKYIPTVVGIEQSKFKEDVLTMIESFDYIILDSPGTLSDELIPAQLFSIADLFLIPIQPSPMDVEDSDQILKMAEATMMNRPQLKARILICRDKEQTILSRTIGNSLEQYDIPLFPVRILDGELHKQVRGTGQTLFDELKGLSKSEKNLVKNMNDFLVSVFEELEGL